VRVRDYDREQLVITPKLALDSYYPGATVQGELTIQRQDGADFTHEPTFGYSVKFGDQATPVNQVMQKVSITGKAYFSFQIPQTASLLFTTISFTVNYDGIEAKATKILVIG